MTTLLCVAALAMPQVKGSVLDLPSVTLTDGLTLKRGGSWLPSDNRAHILNIGDRLKMDANSRIPGCVINPDTSIVHILPGSELVVLLKGRAVYYCLVRGTLIQEMCAHANVLAGSTYRYGLETKDTHVLPNVHAINNHDLKYKLSYFGKTSLTVMMGKVDVMRGKGGH